MKIKEKLVVIILSVSKATRFTHINLLEGKCLNEAFASYSLITLFVN